MPDEHQPPDNDAGIWFNREQTRFLIENLSALRDSVGVTLQAHRAVVAGLQNQADLLDELVDELVQKTGIEPRPRPEN